MSKSPKSTPAPASTPASPSATAPVDVISILPEKVIIIGRDTPHTARLGDSGHALWDERATNAPDEALMRSMLLYPGRVTVEGRRESGEILIEDGRQRVIAARAINEKLVAKGAQPVEIKVQFGKTSTDAVQTMGLGFAFNENRKAVDLLEQAAKLADYLAAGGKKSGAQVVFNVSDQTIRNWLALNSLTPEVKALVQGGQILATAAGKLAKVTDPAEQLAAAKSLIASGDTTKESAAAVANAVQGGSVGAGESAPAPTAESNTTGTATPASAPTGTVRAAYPFTPPRVSELREFLELAADESAKFHKDMRAYLNTINFADMLPFLVGQVDETDHVAGMRDLVKREAEAKSTMKTAAREAAVAAAKEAAKKKAEEAKAAKASATPSADSTPSQ